jgi:hypothetical protein
MRKIAFSTILAVPLALAAGNAAADPQMLGVVQTASAV